MMKLLMKLLMPMMLMLSMSCHSYGRTRNWVTYSCISAMSWRTWSEDAKFCLTLMKSTWRGVIHKERERMWLHQAAPAGCTRCTRCGAPAAFFCARAQVAWRGVFQAPKPPWA